MAHCSFHMRVFVKSINILHPRKNNPDSNRKNLHIGIQNVREILSKGYAYVDKTRFIHQLLEDGKHFFYLGLEDLVNLFIYQMAEKISPPPVLHFDFSRIASNSPKSLDLGISVELKSIGKAHGIDVKGPSKQFQ